MKHTKELLSKLWKVELKRGVGETIPDSSFRKAFDQIYINKMYVTILSGISILLLMALTIAIITIHNTK